MAWTNIFDFCDWDIYVSFRSAGAIPTPDSKNFLVHMVDFDPAAGSIAIVGGEIVMDMVDDPSSGGGQAPFVIAIPKSAHPGGSVRMTYTEGRGEFYVDTVEAYQSNGVTPTSPNAWLPNDPPSPNPMGEVSVLWADDIATLTSAGAVEPSVAITFYCQQKGF